MIESIELRAAQANDPRQVEAIAGLWTGACGQPLAVSTRFVERNLHPTLNGLISTRIAWLDGEPVGFVICSILQNEPSVLPADQGWINALAVLPEMQNRGVGKQLLQWAEKWLHAQGCQQVILGDGIRPFVSGVPTELNTQVFFEQQGYENRALVWDMAINLGMYSQPSFISSVEGEVRPAQPGQEYAILLFLQREFPGRWRYEYQQFLLENARISDYMILWTERGVDGCCRLTFEDSKQPIERFYPYQLPRAWGQLGTVGVSAEQRGKGFGAALVDAGLRRLHNNGVNGCIIDWTTIPSFYEKFGFEMHRSYQPMSKQLT